MKALITSLFKQETILMIFEDINLLLEHGHLPMETGYCRLLDGSMYVAVLTRMFGCKSRWLEWWFNNYDRQEHRIINGHYKRRPEKTVKNSNHIGFPGKYIMDKKTSNFSFELADPLKYFNITKLNASNARVVVFGNTFTPNGDLFGRVVHVARDTIYGCEMRSHFWLYNSTEEMARIRMEHCIEDMGSLADFLRTIIAKIKAENNLPDIVCKICYSDDVIKYGFRKGGQYWLCNNCDHHFLNNQSLYRMKYPLDFITRTVKERSLGKPIKSIRKELLREMKNSPSSSTIYGWIQRLTDISSK
jgi:transposase-like protein